MNCDSIINLIVKTAYSLNVGSQLGYNKNSVKRVKIEVCQLLANLTQLTYHSDRFIIPSYDVNVMKTTHSLVEVICSRLSKFNSLNEMRIHVMQPINRLSGVKFMLNMCIENSKFITRINPQFNEHEHRLMYIENRVLFTSYCIDVLTNIKLGASINEVRIDLFNYHSSIREYISELKRCNSNSIFSLTYYCSSMLEHGSILNAFTSRRSTDVQIMNCRDRYVLKYVEWSKMMIEGIRRRV
jgi:hypothetical protein